MRAKRTSYYVSILFGFVIATGVYGQGLPTAKPEDAGMSTARLERIRPVMQAYVDQGMVPGMITAGARQARRDQDREDSPEEGRSP